jgi:transposase
MNIHLAKSPSNGLHYVYLTESYRDKDGKPKRRFIEKLGILEEMQETEPNVLERLRQEARDLTRVEQENKLISLSIDTSNNIDQSKPMMNIGYIPLKKIYESLNIDKSMKRYQKAKKSKYDLDQILRLLTFMRVIDPSSKLKTYEERTKLFDEFENIKLESVYKGLDDLNEVKDELMIHLNKELMNQELRDASLVFYDVTNYYFESDYTDGFREKGVSKEKQTTGIVQMGLFIDNAGLPITYELFPGNTNDLKTMRLILEKIKKQFNLGKLTIVGDKGNNSSTNLSMIEDYGDHYIIAQRIRNRGNRYSNIVLEQEGYEWNQEQSFKYKLIAFDKEIKQTDGSTKTIKEHLMCFWSKDEEVYQRTKRGLLDDKIQKFLDEPSLLNASNSFGIKKYFKKVKIDNKTGEILKGKDKYLFNQAKYERDIALDGYYTIVTNNLDLHPFDIIKHYRQLSKIEESFKVTKSDLEGRPIYVWTESHIRGHFLTCYLALLLLRVLQLKLKNRYTVPQIIEGIRKANVIEIAQDIFKLTPASKSFYELTQMLNLTLNKDFMKRESIRKQL